MIFDHYLYPGQEKEKVIKKTNFLPYKRVHAFGLINLSELIWQGKLVKRTVNNLDIPIYYIQEWKEEKIKEGFY